MFATGLIVTVLSFVLIMEVPVIVTAIEQQLEEDVEMDLDLKPKDERDLIAAAQKVETMPKVAEQINKVDETTEAVEELPEPEPLPVDNPEIENVEDEDPPINLNEDDPEVMRIVEELPQYPGGMVEFMKWLTATLKYPPVALQRKIQGTVIVSFIVNTDGSISNVKLEKKVNSYLDNEALRVVRLMPNWTPGKDHGVVCRSKIAIPIVFEV